MKKIIALSLGAMALSGCDFMQNHVGKYMPVIGQRCDNWQCFTSEGQAESNAKERYYNHTATGSAAPSSTTATNGRTPLNGAQNPETTAPVATPAAAPAPAPAGPKSQTPFDMTPDELNSMPNPYGSTE